MTFNPDIHHRKSIRLRTYDYSLAGLYFMTICVKNRECLLGEIIDGVMKPNEAGNSVSKAWYAIPNRFPCALMDAFVVMPNHIHGIIHVGAPLAAPKNNICGIEQGAASSAPTIGQIIRAFKSLSAITINELLNRQGQPFWQRNYWERVIRSETELQTIRAYIKNNPAQWQDDSLYEVKLIN